MDFFLAFQQPPTVHDIDADALDGQQVALAWQQYIGAMAAAGIMRSGTQLDPRNANAVRVRDGQRHTRQGPSAEGHALLGGFAVITVESLEEALHWAERSPSSSAGYTEVIPVVPPTGA